MLILLNPGWISDGTETLYVPELDTRHKEQKRKQNGGLRVTD